MRDARGADRCGEGELDASMGRKLDDAVGGEEVLGRVCAAEDLKQDRDRGRDEAGVVNKEVSAILPKNS